MFIEKPLSRVLQYREFGHKHKDDKGDLCDACWAAVTVQLGKLSLATLPSYQVYIE